MTSHSTTPLYEVWRTIRKRCYQKDYKDYPNYGGRGIKMYPEWEEDFEKFYSWAMTHGYKPGLTIDRVANNRGYNPGNCRWVSRKTQANNRRTNTKIEKNGEVHNISQWSKINGIPETTIVMRIQRGMDPAEAVSKPVKKHKK